MAIGIIINPICLKKLKLITTFIKTINKERKKGFFVSSLAKKKFDKTLIKAKAGIPYPKYFNASEVIKISSFVKEPYPNNALIICSCAMIIPKLAGKDNRRDNSSDLFCILKKSW